MALSRKGKIVIGITAVVLLAIIIAVTVFATRKGRFGSNGRRGQNTSDA